VFHSFPPLSEIESMNGLKTIVLQPHLYPLDPNDTGIAIFIIVRFVLFSTNEGKRETNVTKG
jgi:hypothetical protein